MSDKAPVIARGAHDCWFVKPPGAERFIATGGVGTYSHAELAEWFAPLTWWNAVPRDSVEDRP